MLIVYNSVMKTKKILSYTVIFEKAAEGGYVVSVPLLQGCMTQGETFEEAKENIKDAISSYIAVLREDGDQIPVESGEHISMTIEVPVHV